jgi:hypothetical protein
MGCPPGFVLSSLVCSLVIDKLLTDLNSQGYRVFGFANKVVIRVRGKLGSVLSEQMHPGLNNASNWCKEANLDGGNTIHEEASA